MELNHRNRMRILSIIITSIVVYLGLKNISSLAGVLWSGLGLISPLIIGIFMAYILNVPLKLIENTLFSSSKKPFILKIKRPVSILLTILLVAAILFFILFLLIPQLGSTIGILTNSIKIFFENVPKQVMEWSDRIPELEEWLVSLKIDWNDIGKSIVDFVKNSAAGVVGSTVSVISSIFSGAFDFTVGFIFCIYALASKEKLARQARRILYAYLPEKRADKVVSIGILSNKTFSSFVTGQLTEALILGVLCFIGMAIFRFPFALMTSVLVGFTALIPVFGAFIGTAIGAFMILMVNPIQALWFIVYIIVLQQIEGNLIYPRVMGSSVGLPAMWVLAAVTLGGSTMGILGMLIFVPVFSVLYSLLRESISDRLEIKKIARHKLS